MKKTLLITFGLLFLGFSLFASEVSIDRASKVAGNMYYIKVSSQNGLNYDQIHPVLLYTSESGGMPVYYVFGIDNQQGWVIVSATDAVYPIIGYSTENTYIVEEFQQPPAFASWMQMVKNTLLEKINYSFEANSDVASSWDKLENLAPLNSDSPLSSILPLTTTLWDQGCYFNQNCPATGGVHPAGPCNRALTGCVATAMSMIMKYWNFPAHGTSSHSYVDPANTTSSCPTADPSYGTLSRTFNTNYDWWDMPDVPTNSSTGIPALMSDCGISVDMNYAYCTSGAWPPSDPVVANALKNYFYYAASTSDAVRANYTDTQWYNLMKGELNNSRPIDYGNQNHSWVCDGYDDNYNGIGLYFHMNWGWSGGSNGYFTLNSANVGTLQEAIIGIYPTYQAPIAPTNVTASQGEYSGAIWIDWRWASNATHYRVYRNTVNNSGTSTAISGWQTSTTYEDATCLPSSTYYYWVKSATSSGGANASGFSPVATGYTTAPGVLTSGTPIFNSETPRYMTFTNANNYWAAVGIRSAYNTDDWDISMYTDNTFSTVAAASTLGAGAIDFVVVDGNHTNPISRGLKINRYSGSSICTAEFDGGPNQLNEGNNNNISWGVLDIVKCWDVYLTPGTYQFKLTFNSGSLNPGLALFSSTGGSYFFGRTGALSTVDANGDGLGESLFVTVTTADYYGFVVFGNNPSASNFNVRIERAGTWTGAVDNNWHNAGNWSADYVPTADLDITIPSVINQPWIWVANATCHNVTVEAGASNYLRIYNNSLNITGNATIYGQLMMDNNVATAQCIVTGNIVWGSGSSAWMTALTTLNIYGNLEFQPGADVHLTAGNVNFYGSLTSYIYSNENTCYLNHLTIAKTGSAGVWYSASSTRSLHIMGNFYVNATSAFVCNSDSALYLGGFLYSLGDFHCNYGSVIFNGTNSSINILPANYFNNLRIEPSGYVGVNTDIAIQGDLTIASGILYSNSYTISVGKNWNNWVGTSAFSEASGRVIFNGGNYHQYCSTENFNTLEVNKPSGGAFRMSGTDVYCVSYDWTAGAVDVLSGSFTAMDLIDNGISGAFYLNPGGTINLHNPSGYVDLNGDVYIFGGNFNVYGGTTESYWPYTHNASLTMSGGTLDFKETGIKLFNTPTYTFSETIIGGTIRTVGSFLADRSEFTPSGGIIELYGPIGAYLTTTNGASIANLNILKTGLPTILMNSTLNLTGNLNVFGGNLNSNGNNITIQGYWKNYVGDAGFTEGNSDVTFTGASPSQLLSDETFYNLIENKSYLSVNGLELQSGLNLTVSNSLNIIDGTLELDNNTELNLKTLTIALNAGLNASASNVNIYVLGNWIDNNNLHNTLTGFFPGSTSTVTFTGGVNQSMTTPGATEPFRNLIIDKSAGNFVPASGIDVSGNFSLLGGTFDCAVSGLSHYFQGDMTVVPTATWYACQQTVYFTGSNNQNLNFEPNSGYFNNVVLSKSVGSKVTLLADAISLNNGSLLINAGKLDLNGKYYRCTGNVTINNGGSIYIPASSWLEVGDNYSLTVNNGGLFELFGTNANPAKLTHHAGNYNCSIESGGTISAENAIFEFAGINGIYIKNGAIVDYSHPFTACTFRYGLSSGSLLRIDNNQTFNVNDAVFPYNSWSGVYNVSKTINQGMVNFINYSGAFGGTSFEYDPNGLVNWTPIGGNQLSGILSYDNAVNTVLNNSKVLLKSGASFIDSTITNASGYYLFPNVTSGVYTLDGRCTKPWGGVNSTDALKIMKHFVGISPLSGVRLSAADVDGSHFINSLDALLAMKRFVGTVTYFPAGDWVFEKPALTLTGGIVSQNYKGICYGDVDGTYVPAAKHEPEVQLITEGMLSVQAGEIIPLPLNVRHDMNVGAVSLELNIIQPGIVIRNVRTSNLEDQLFWNVDNDKLRIAWASLTPMELRAGEPLLTLDLETNAQLSTLNTGLIFSTGSDCELAGGEAEVLVSEILSMPKLVSISESSSFQLGNCYPNPFSETTHVPFYVPESGTAKIILTDVTGREVYVLDAGTFTKGQHTVSFNRDNLSAGTYSLQMIVNTQKGQYTDSERIVVTK